MGSGLGPTGAEGGLDAGVPEDVAAHPSFRAPTCAVSSGRVASLPLSEEADQPSRLGRSIPHSLRHSGVPQASTAPHAGLQDPAAETWGTGARTRV